VTDHADNSNISSGYRFIVSQASPEDGAINIMTHPVLSVHVDDPNDDAANVSFYEWKTGSFVIDDESEWNEGSFANTTTDGNGSLQLVNDTSIFGDGSDGNVTIPPGTTTLTKDMNYHNLTMPSGRTLNTAGFIVKVSGALTNYGTITDSSSGGSGGSGGDGGRGQDPWQNSGGPSTPDDGDCGTSGSGRGGNGGDGGAGGGGAKAKRTTWPYDERDADGGDGGDGGNGGCGGGEVIIYAYKLDNQGVIHADGEDGDDGEDATIGEYYDWPAIPVHDLAGGGGGGGDGGDGGDGGFVNITYAVLLNLSEEDVHADGGDGGNKGSRGGRYQCVKANYVGWDWWKYDGGDGCGDGLDGDGGHGEYEQYGFSGYGYDGADGSDDEGQVTLTCHRYVSSGSYSKIFDAGVVVGWLNATINQTAPTGTSVTVGYGENTSDFWKYYDDIDDVPDCRWLKVRINLSTTNYSVTPSIDKINISSCRILLNTSINVSDGSFAVYNWTGLSLNTTYNWQVRLFNEISSVYGPVWDFKTIETRVFDLSNVSNTPDIVGFGFNVTISANLTDNDEAVSLVSVNITYPDDTFGNFTMNNAVGNTYEYVFSDTWLVGQYNYTIWAVDKANNSNTSSGHIFNVSAQANVSIQTLKDEYGSNEYVNLTDPPGGGGNTGWTIIERGANFVRRQNITNPNIFSWESAPQWVYNGTAWVPYIFNETDDYYQVQSGVIGTRIYKDGYAEFWNPDMTEVRLYEERWILEYYDGDKWKVCDVYSPTFAVENDNTTINITASFITDFPNSGERAFDVKYIFKEGRPLKHEITFTSHSTEEYLFRVKQKWAGIVTDKVKHSKGTDTITAPTTVNSSWFKFQKDDGSLSIFENQWEMYYVYNKTTHRHYVLENHNLKPVEIDVHTQGMKADFVFGNWTLSQNESLTIDPDTATFDDPTEDGYIQWGDYSDYEDPTIIRFADGNKIYFGLGEGYWYWYWWPFYPEGWRKEWRAHKQRGYVEWDISSLAGKTLTANPVFKYEGGRDTATEEEINPITEGQPSVVSDGDLYSYIASGTAYVDPFDVEGDRNEEVDLGASARSDLQDAMDASQSWFAIGFQANEVGNMVLRTDVEAEEADCTPPPTLYVEHRFSPGFYVL